MAEYYSVCGQLLSLVITRCSGDTFIFDNKFYKLQEFKCDVYDESCGFIKDIFTDSKCFKRIELDFDGYDE